MVPDFLGVLPVSHEDKLVLSKARDALGLDKCKVFIAGLLYVLLSYPVCALSGSGARTLFLASLFSASRPLSAGAAPISRETLEYFGQLGMMIQNAFGLHSASRSPFLQAQVYGMSESAGIATLCHMNFNEFGSVGQAPAGLEVKLFKSGPNGENIEARQHAPLKGLRKVPRAKAGLKVAARRRFQPHVRLLYICNMNICKT